MLNMKNTKNYDEKLKDLCEAIELEKLDACTDKHEFSEHYIEQKSKLIKKVQIHGSLKQ